MGKEKNRIIGLAIVCNQYADDDNYGRVLIARRAEPKTLPSGRKLHWQFPYAEVLQLESLSEALKKNVYAQVGLSVKILEEIYFWQHVDHRKVDGRGRKIYPVMAHYFLSMPAESKQKAKPDGKTFAEVLWAEPEKIPMRSETDEKSFFTTVTPERVVECLDKFPRYLQLMESMRQFSLQ